MIIRVVLSTLIINIAPGVVSSFLCCDHHHHHHEHYYNNKNADHYGRTRWRRQQQQLEVVTRRKSTRKQTTRTTSSSCSSSRTLLRVLQQQEQEQQRECCAETTTTTTSSSSSSEQSSRPPPPLGVPAFKTKHVTTITIPRFLDDDDDDDTRNDDGTSSTSGRSSSRRPYPSKLHSIHVRSIMSDDEVKHCLDIATRYAKENQSWNQPNKERHASYSTCDFPIDECYELDQYLDDTIQFHDRIWNDISELYNIRRDCMNYIDLFCSQYQANTNTTTTTSTTTTHNNNTTTTETTTMDRLEAHRDGSLLSYTLLLNDPSTNFEGGGTFFDALRDVKPPPAAADDDDDDASNSHSGTTSILHNGGIIRPQRAGDIIYHCGKILHGADIVTTGNRVVMVGFIHIPTVYIKSNIVSFACREWGRIDNIQRRYEYQKDKMNNMKKNRMSRNSSNSSCSNNMTMTKNNNDHSQSTTTTTRRMLNGWFTSDIGWKIVSSSSSSTQRRRQRPPILRFCPSFSSVKRRANPERMRILKLKAEDALLRTILFNQDEVQWDPHDEYDDEYDEYDDNDDDDNDDEYNDDETNYPRDIYNGDITLLG